MFSSAIVRLVGARSCAFYGVIVRLAAAKLRRGYSPITTLLLPHSLATDSFPLLRINAKRSYYRSYEYALPLVLFFIIIRAFLYN